MPGMSLPNPPFCQLLPSPTPLPLPATRLVSARFDTAQLRPEDFPDSGIPPVRGVAKRQAEYLAGRLCAREALHQLCGQALVPVGGGLLYVPVEWVKPAEMGMDRFTSIYVSMGITPPTATRG